MEPVILMKLAPASVATALASRVLPVPGGPNNKTPLQGCPTGHQLSNKIRKKGPHQQAHRATFSSRSILCFLLRGNQESAGQMNWMDTRVKFPLENSSGRCKGSITSSLRALLTFSRAPM